MKARILKTLMMTALLTAGLSASAAETAGYTRAWQGFRKTDVSCADFLKALPSFVTATVTLYKDQNNILSNYIMVVPPKNKPDYIPDELTFLAYTSKDAYQAIRNTDAGKAYGDLHWTIFNREVSKSSEPIVMTDEVAAQGLQHNQAYDTIGQPLDWSTGYNAVYIGTRKDGVSGEEFRRRLLNHVLLARSVMNPKGLRGYTIISNDNYEIAYLNWSSQADHDAALATTEGQNVFADAGRFMDTLMYVPASTAPVTEVVEGQAYSTVKGIL